MNSAPPKPKEGKWRMVPLVLIFAVLVGVLVWLALPKAAKGGGGDGAKPTPHDPDEITYNCADLGICVCGDKDEVHGHVVGRFLVDDPTKKLIDTHHLVEISGQSAAAWLENDGKGRHCPVACPLEGEVLKFKDGDGIKTVDSLYPPKKDDPTWRAPTWPEVPTQLDDGSTYLPACDYNLPPGAT